MSFYETKPRKAKFAFEVRMSEDILKEGLLFAAMNTALMRHPESNETWWKEYRNGAGTYSLHIYVNSPDVYEEIKQAIAPFGK